MGHVERIFIKRGRRGPMDAVITAALRAGRGLVGNANQGGKRQVTLLAQEHWQEVVGALGPVDPAVRRANLLLSGVDLRNSRGSILHVGRVRIRIHGETRPCEQMEEVVAGLRAAMSVPWGGGAFGEVLDDGDIVIGDAATFE